MLSRIYLNVNVSFQVLSPESTRGEGNIIFADSNPALVGGAVEVVLLITDFTGHRNLMLDQGIYGFIRHI